MSSKESEDPEEKPPVRKDSDHIILYNPIAKKVRIGVRRDFPGKYVQPCRHIRLMFDLEEIGEPHDRVPRLGRWFNVHEYPRGEERRGLVLSVLSLHNLSWANTWRRRLGKCNDIYFLYDEDEDQPRSGAAG